MNDHRPGTTVRADLSRRDAAHELLSPMFLSGGLVLSQVSALSGLEPYTVQNWVKRGFLPPPVHKKYDSSQVCRIFIINMLRPAMQMERICALLSYINGDLSDTSDDSIDDFTLYGHIVRQIGGSGGPLLPDDWREPFPGAAERIRQVMEIIVTAYRASELQRRADELCREIGI